MGCIDIPLLNPIRFNENGIFEQQIDNAYYTDYLQKYNKSDITSLQFIVNCGLNPALEAYKDGILQSVGIYSRVFNYGSFRAVNFDIDFADFDGIYQFKLSAGTEVYWSNKIQVCENHQYTRFISYYNKCNEQNVSFATGIIFGIRVEAMMFNSLTPKRNNTFYTNDLGGQRVLGGYPYDSYTLNIGATKGIPDWIISTINRAFALTNVYLDGKRISVTDGAELESNSTDNYNLRSWSIEVQFIDETFTSERPFALLVEPIAHHFIATGGEKFISIQSNVPYIIRLVGDIFPNTIMRGGINIIAGENTTGDKTMLVMVHNMYDSITSTITQDDDFSTTTTTTTTTTTSTTTTTTTTTTSTTTTTTTTKQEPGYYIQYYGFGETLFDAHDDYTGSVKGQIWYHPNLGYFTNDTLATPAMEGSYLLTWNADISKSVFLNI